MNTAIIGNGYWSGILRPCIAKKFNIKYVADSQFDLKQIWKDSSVDSVFIVTPIETHYELAKEALLHGKHVFIEKPLTTSSKKAKELKKLAEQGHLSIVTDYTYTFSPNLQNEAKKDIEYIEIKLYRDNSDKYTNTNVHWVLSCHALSIVDMFMDIKSAKFYMLEPFVGMIIGNGFKIFTSLISPEKVTDIVVADSTFVHTIPVELDNLERAVEYFYNCVYHNSVSNLDTAICITEVIEKGLCKC
jgi:hypothetical protein